MRFANFDIDLFLRDYWQKRPLLIRNPWVDWASPLDPDDLAGLACESEVESRIITRAGDGWGLDHGPFAEERFAQQGVAPWTLLVQAVDHYVAEVAALIEPFRFVPDWRIDDVMVSYASTGGGVGPHFDQYDVFLIQGLGRRRWRVGGMCDESAPLVPHDGLRLLADFTPEDEWVLEPGDILYLPPRVAHDGVAESDDCMTYSIGFRAPSRRDLIEDWSEQIAQALPDADRYADPDLRPQANPGEIAAPALARLHEMVTQALADRDGFAHWFGGHCTTPKYPEADWRPDAPFDADDVRAVLADDAPLRRNPASRFAFIRQADGVLLFADGHSFPCVGPLAALAEQICAAEEIWIDSRTTQSDAALALIVALLDQGSLAFEDEDDDDLDGD